MSDETLDGYVCHLCGPDQHIETADEAIEHLVESHSMNEIDATNQVEGLTDG